MAPGAGRLLPGHPRRRPRRLPHARARADGRARGGRSSRSSRSTSPTAGATRCSFFGDYYLAHTYAVGRRRRRRLRRRCRPKDWALDGSTGGTGRAKLVSPLGDRKQRDDVGYDLAEHYQRVRGHDRRRWSPASSRWSRPASATTPSVVVVAFGTPAKYVRYAVRAAARRGRTGSASCGPITLFPFPTERGRRRGRRRARGRGLREQPGPDGRRRAPRRARALRRCEFIGGLSLDSSGFGIAPDLDVEHRSARIRASTGGASASMDRIEGLPVDPAPTTAPPSRRPAGRRLHARAHRRRRAPPLPRLRRADRDALGARGRSTSSALIAARHRRVRHRLLHRVLQQPRLSRCCRRCTAGRRRWPPA